MIGRVIGNYKIIEALGEGGVGMVYKGVDTMLDREVAIKVLRPELATQNSVVERFRSEAVTLAKLNHPNIATLYSLFRQGDDLFMVMEFINGETLDQLLCRQGSIPTGEAIPIFCQALEGISYAHERGIVHRDIKPSNMMMTESGSLKVLDFGIARLLGGDRMTRVGNVIGTLEYMSPEQVHGHETDSRSDVYGLGIMLYEMLTGRLPFESENDFELMLMQTEQVPHLPRLFNPDIPVQVEAAIMKAIAKNPDDRFQSAEDFLNTILELEKASPNLNLVTGTMYGFKKSSRPSKPGLRQGEIKQVSSEISISASQNPEIQILLESNGVIPVPRIITVSAKPTPSATLALGNEKVIESNFKQTGDKAAQQAEIKGTRVASSVVTNPNDIKSTRLRVMPENKPIPVENKKSQTFFDGLGWLHYISAGTAVFFLFGLVTAAVILPSMWDDAKVKEEPNNIGQKSPEPKNTPIPPTVVKEQVSSPNLTQEQTLKPDSNPAPVITPIPNNPPPVTNQPKDRQPLKNNPSPPPKNNDTPKQTKTKKNNDNDLQKILTGKNK